MSVAKLTIHKYDDNTNFKTLNIIINDEGDVDAQFSNWQNGENALANRNTERSPRLVVKIVSGFYYSQFNLDTCARVLKDDSETFISKSFTDCSNKYDSKDICYIKNDEDNAYPYNFNLVENNKTDENDINSKILAYDDICSQGMKEINIEGVHSLENSLEKVRENNARIMKNIHLLNRTLYYTKKKEMLKIFSKSTKTFSCNTCGKSFVYETGLRRHYSLTHAIIDTQPRWEDVWICIHCFQVWPRQDQAIKHSSTCFKEENAEYVREIKTSSLLQCEFCEKVFTSIPRLLRHSKSHTTFKNYVCNACSIAFVSYKIAEQHWVSCSWLKMYYSFSLQKMLLCNACDRKFRSYDQLYNHR